MAYVEHEEKKEISKTTKRMTPEEAADIIKAIAKDIRESSLEMRNTLRVLHKSGSIEDLAEAIRTAALATRDAAKEINEISKDLKERGIIRDTKGAIEATSEAIHDTQKTLSESLHEESKEQKTKSKTPTA